MSSIARLIRIRQTAKNNMDNALDPLAGTVIDACREFLQKGFDSVGRPSVLYHFTAAAGMVGILANRCIWVSLATSSTDRSEILYGVRMAEEVIVGLTPTSAYPEFLYALGAYLSDPQQAPSGLQLEMPSFTFSMCGCIDKSIHWLHYGRHGTGVALGFDTTKIAVNSLELARVDYEPESQRKRIKGLIDVALTELHRATESGVNQPDPQKLVAHITALHLRVLAGQLKNPAFREEEEWRLIGYQVLDGGTPIGGSPSTTKYRALGGRVVPYEETKFSDGDGMPVKEIVLGFSSPLEPDDPEIKLLIADTGIRARVYRSTVPVR